MVRSEQVSTLFESTQTQESEVSAHEFYTAMRIKTHLDNAVCFKHEHEHELVVAEAPAGFEIDKDVRKQ